MMAGRIVTIASSADTAAEMAAAEMAVTTAIMATARKPQATVIRAARIRMATRPVIHRPPGKKPPQGSQTASEMLHSCSVRTSRAATPAIGPRS